MPSFAPMTFSSSTRVWRQRLRASWIPTGRPWAGRQPGRPTKAWGTAPGRGGTRPRQLQYRWPIGYQNWECQLAANVLGSAVRDELNRRTVAFAKQDGTAWTLREVEAVLFMEGY